MSFFKDYIEDKHYFVVSQLSANRLRQFVNPEQVLQYAVNYVKSASDSCNCSKVCDICCDTYYNLRDINDILPNLIKLIELVKTIK